MQPNACRATKNTVLCEPGRFWPIRTLNPRRRSRGAAAVLIIGLATVTPAIGQAEPEPLAPAERLAEVSRSFDPAVTRLPDESRVLRTSVLAALVPDDPARQAALKRLLTRHGAVVLNDDQPGLTLRYAAEGIEAMTFADRLYEGLPRRAESIQALIDHAITRARVERRPIQRLVIIGHAGLPGCAAFGNTLHDCVFDGKLTGYQRRQLARLRPYLAQDAEIELRQCVTGRGEEGQRLLTALHDLTGAAVSSYLADFHFGDSANHPRIRVDLHGTRFIEPR